MKYRSEIYIKMICYCIELISVGRQSHLSVLSLLREYMLFEVKELNPHAYSSAHQVITLLDDKLALVFHYVQCMYVGGGGVV